VRRPVVQAAAVACLWVLFRMAGGAEAASPAPPFRGTLGPIAAISLQSGVAASAPTVTSSAPCNGVDADGTKNPDQNSIAVLLLSPSLHATRPQGEAVQTSTASYSRTTRMSVPFGQTFTDAYRLAGATIKGGERVEIRMVCLDALGTQGGTFEGSVTFSADASRYAADGLGSGTSPGAGSPGPVASFSPGAGASAAPGGLSSPAATRRPGDVPTAVTPPIGSALPPIASAAGGSSADQVAAPSGVASLNSGQESSPVQTTFPGAAVPSSTDLVATPPERSARGGASHWWPWLAGAAVVLFTVVVVVVRARGRRARVAS